MIESIIGFGCDDVDWRALHLCQTNWSIHLIDDHSFSFFLLLHLIHGVVMVPIFNLPKNNLHFSVQTKKSIIFFSLTHQYRSLAWWTLVIVIYSYALWVKNMHVWWSDILSAKVIYCIWLIKIDQWAIWARCIDYLGKQSNSLFQSVIQSPSL